MSRPLRSRSLAPAILALTLLLAPLASAQDAGLSLRTFQRCWEAVQRSFYDRDFHGVDWDAVYDRYRPRAVQARPGAELRGVLKEMLAELRASHTTILTPEVHSVMADELANRRYLTFGFQLEESEEGFFFVRALYEGSPAETAGLRVGDRVVLVDGLSPDRSPLLTDAGYDPALPGAPLYWLTPGDSPRMELLVQPTREPSSRRSLELNAREMNGVDALRNSVRVIPRKDVRVGYLHLWFCSRDVTEEIREALTGRLAECDALVFDLRGRGGYARVVTQLLDLFRQRRSPLRNRVVEPVWTRPVVFLIDRRSRSAKEVMAYVIREDGLGLVVGERTEGAVLGAGHQRLPDGSILELAILDVSVRGVRLEGTGVEPDHLVTWPIPYSEGSDPILERGINLAEAQARRTADSRR